MALQNEGNTSLAFDTQVLRDYGKKYGQIADRLRNLASDLDDCLSTLTQSGWTTEAGKTFESLVDTNWQKNMNKYANLLDTLETILGQAATEYENLEDNHIEKTKL